MDWKTWLIIILYALAALAGVAHFWFKHKASKMSETQTATSAAGTVVDNATSGNSATGTAATSPDKDALIASQSAKIKELTAQVKDLTAQVATLSSSSFVAKAKAIAATAEKDIEAVWEKAVDLLK